MVRGPNSKKNDVLHDHMHLESENQSSAPVARAAILFYAKNRHFPCISQRVIPAHFFRYGLKYSFQVRNFGGHNLVTGLKQFTQLSIDGGTVMPMGETNGQRNVLLYEAELVTNAMGFPHGL